MVASRSAILTLVSGEKAFAALRSTPRPPPRRRSKVTLTSILLCAQGAHQAVTVANRGTKRAESAAFAARRPDGQLLTWGGDMELVIFKGRVAPIRVVPTASFLCMTILALALPAMAVSGPRVLQVGTYGGHQGAYTSIQSAVERRTLLSRGRIRQKTWTRILCVYNSAPNCTRKSTLCGGS